MDEQFDPEQDALKQIADMISERVAAKLKGIMPPDEEETEPMEEMSEGEMPMDDGGGSDPFIERLKKAAGK